MGEFFSFKSAWIFAWLCFSIWLKCYCSTLLHSLCASRYSILVFLKTKCKPAKKIQRNVLLLNWNPICRQTWCPDNLFMLNHFMVRMNENLPWLSLSFNDVWPHFVFSDQRWCLSTTCNYILSRLKNYLQSCCTLFNRLGITKISRNNPQIVLLEHCVSKVFCTNYF